MRHEEQYFEFGKIESAADGIAPVLLAAALAACVWWLYRRDGAELGRTVRRLLVLCRTIVVAALCWVYLDPRLRTETQIEQPSRVAVLLDGSQSMTIADAGPAGASPVTRHERLQQVVVDEGLAAALRRRHEVAIYQFGRSLVPLAVLSCGPGAESETPDEWRRLATANDDLTRLGSAIETVLQRESQSLLAGVIILSDGGLNGGDDPAEAIRQAQRARVPIHAIGLGNVRAPLNVSIVDLVAPERAFRGDEIEVQVELRATAADGQTVPVEIVATEPGGQTRLLGRRDVTFGSDRKPQRARFGYVPQRTGRLQLLARVPIDPRELRHRLDGDNELGRTIEIVDRKTKVLLFSGGPGREYQFLRNLLYREKSVELSVLLQSAAGPVAQEADAVLQAFPEQREKLFAFDVVVALDPDWTVVSERGRQLLREWVDRHAGGLVLLAGPVYTARLARDASLAPLKALYPVVLQESLPLEAASQRTEPAALVLTPEGLASGWIQRADEAEPSRRAWDQWGVYAPYPVSSVRPGASVLARLASASGAPVLAMQYFGGGKVFFSAASEFWRLRKFGETLYDRFWIGLVREMGHGRLQRGSSRGSLLLEADQFPLGREVRLAARLVDEGYRPLVAETVPLHVVDPSGQQSTLELAAEPGHSGQFAATFLPNRPGAYRLQLLVPRSTEVIERTVDVRPGDAELVEPAQNRALLERLAAETGGRYSTPADAGKLVDLVPDRRETRVLSGPVEPLWDRAWLMLLVAGLLSIEWLVRKLQRLA